MPCVSLLCTQIYRIRVGSMTTTRPAYIMPYCALDCCACIRFKSPTGSVFGPLAELISVMEIIYSFQKDRKLNKITVIIEGFAIGKIIFHIAVV